MGPSVQSSSCPLGRRRNVLEQAENVGIEYLDIDVELPGVGEDGTMALEEGLTAGGSSPPVVASNCGPTAVTIQMS